MLGSDYQRVAAAIRFFEANLTEQPRLADLARHLGLSEFHVHRMFRRWAGITPKDFLQVLTLARAKKLLASSCSILDASLALGLSGSGRMHDLFVTLEAMTPGEFKAGAAGVTLLWSIQPTRFGPALLAATRRGLCWLSFVDDDPDEPRALAELQQRWPEADLREDSRAVQSMAREVDARMAGEAGRPLTLALKGTPFQVKVWQALLAIPEGHVATYSAIARSIARPEAARAVGHAVAANPIAYLIPCHRVIRATGAVGSYHWGAPRKEVLLAVECARRPRLGRSVTVR